MQTPKSGTKYPKTGEIDLMKYADQRTSETPSFYERSIASNEDVRSLLVISGI